MATVPSYDLIVVGCGFHGLSVAKTYLDIVPSASILLLDVAPTPGGVWSADRLYPGLKTNNRYRKYEFGHFPMDGESLTDDCHIPAKTVHDYLCSYAERFDLIRRTQFNSKVETAEQQSDQGWLLTISSPTDVDLQRRQIHAAQLVVATGLTSTPWMPAFEGMETFNAPLFHAKDFAARASSLKQVTNVTVLSGGKSAWDVAYAFANAGVQVNWVIRKSGHGPCWMTPRRVMGPLQIQSEKLISTRFVTWLSPCIWGDADGYSMVRYFLSRTWLGRKIVDQFAAGMQHGAIHTNGYDSHPETQKLKPWTNVFWTGSNRGLINYDTDIFQLVRDGKIRVHIEDITHLSDHTVHLSNNTQLRTDALICCTGWKHAVPIKFLRDGQDIASELGLPYRSKEALSPLVQRADAEILTSFPRLINQPRINTPSIRALEPFTSPDSTSSVPTEPYTLYRFMIPPQTIHTRTLAFAGIVRNASTAWLAQVQALWLVAYFTNKLPHLAHNGENFDAAIQYEAVLHARFGRWRFPCGFGRYFPDFFFDALPYVDLMLRELGLRHRRKSSTWKEWFEAYGPSDYEKLTEEWLEMQDSVREGKESTKRKGGKQEKQSMTRWSVTPPRGDTDVAWSLGIWKGDFKTLLAPIAGFVLLLSIFTSGVFTAK